LFLGGKVKNYRIGNNGKLYKNLIIMQEGSAVTIQGIKLDEKSTV